MDSPKTFVVAGATGWQGGAAARHLKKAGHRVIGITHTPSKAMKLEGMGIEPLITDLRDPATLESKLKGVDGFFIVTDPFSSSTEKDEWDSPTWAKDEIRQGEGALKAAQIAKIPHVVLTSVTTWAQEKGLGVHKSKVSIERAAKKHGLPCTILRPPGFMEGSINDAWHKAPYSYIRTGEIDSWPLRADTPVPHIATDDIGRIAAWSFAHPDQSVGEAWEIVGEIITFPAIARSLSKRLGRPFVFVETPSLDDVGPFFTALIQRDYEWDPRVWESKFGFPMTTFEEFLNTTDLNL